MGAGGRDLPAVRLTSLRLADFRNYEAARLSLTHAFVVFVGANGAGKTNLLEAISLLTPGRGLRRALLAEMARQGGSQGFAVEAGLWSAANEHRLAVTLRPSAAASGSPAREVRIDETSARSGEELLDLLRIVWLTPAMDGLFTGPAGDRRRFLDRMVLAIDPAHGRRASDYEHAMRSRNRLLAEDRLDDAWLSAIEAQMAELGTAMALARIELVRLLTDMIDRSASGSPFPKAGLDLASGYEELDASRPSADLEDAAARRLAAQRRRDLAAGRTLEGPHRAELSVSHVEKAMPAALSSTGEQKALLIGLVLAHARLVTAVAGVPPVLLLDEIAAHLDPGRRAALFDLVDGLGVQAFMTGTDRSLFDALGNRAQIVEIADGSVRPLDESDPGETGRKEVGDG